MLKTFSSGYSPDYDKKKVIPVMQEIVRMLNMTVTNIKHTLALSSGSASAIMRHITSRKM